MKRTLLYIANRFWLILSLYAVSVLLAASLFSHFEGKPFADGLWWAVITALTVGYGDFSPATQAGRVTGMVFGHFWIFGIVPLIVGNIVCKVLQDEDRFTHDEQEWVKQALQKIAAKSGVDLPPPPSGQ